MSRKLTLDEQIERAQQVVQSWSVQKRSTMRLQGTDNFHERMNDQATSLQMKSSRPLLVVSSVVSRVGK